MILNAQFNEHKTELDADFGVFGMYKNGHDNCAFDIIITQDEETGVFFANKTYEEAFAAHEAGNIVRCVITGNVTFPVPDSPYGESYFVDCVYSNLWRFGEDRIFYFQNPDIYGLSVELTFQQDDLIGVWTDRVNSGGSGSGSGLHITDDGAGNVTISSSGGVSITDDGNGNVTIR